MKQLRLLALPGVGHVAPMSVTVATSLFIQAVTLVSGVVLARGLGPDGRGELAVAMLWAPLLAGLGGLGVAEAVTYQASKEATRESDALTSAVFVGLGQSVLLTIVGIALVPVLLQGKPPNVLHASMFYLLIIPLYPLTLYPLAVLQGRSIGAFNLARISVHLLYTGLVSLLWFFGRLDVFNAVVASLLATSGSFLVTAYLAWIGGYVSLKPVSWVFRSLVGFGLKLHLGNVAGLIALRLDLVFLSFLSTSQAVGMYSVAMAAAAGITLVPNAVSLFLFPAFSRDDATRREQRLARVFLVGGVLTILVVPIAIVLMPVLLPLVFGSLFRSAGVVAQVLLIGSLLRGWASVLTAVIRGAGQPLTASAGDVLGVLTLAGLLIVLVPMATAIGAAIAVSASAVVQVAWLLAQALRCTGLSFDSMLRWWAADIRRHSSWVGSR